MKLEAIELIIHYNDYIELKEDLNEIANSIQELDISEKYKVNLPQGPIVISGIVPVVSIEFCKGENYETFAVLSIDNSVLRFGLKVKDKNISLEKYEEILSRLKELFLKIWDTFNKVAKRKIIERIGLISLAEETNENFYDRIKKSMFKKEIDYKYYSLRFFDIVKDDIHPLKDTLIIKNLIIDTDLVPKELNLRALKLVNDIATTPSSSGILDVEKIAYGVDKLIEFSKENMKELLEVVQDD